MLSSSQVDNQAMYLLVQHPDRVPRVLGPYKYAFMRDMEAVSIHTSEANDPIESRFYMIDIRKEQKAVVECYPAKFFDFLHCDKAIFRIDDGPGFAGYTDGASWNGWAMPYFTREIAMEVLKAYPGDEADDEDAYRNYQFPEEDSVIIIDPETGKPIQVWPIGSGGWCWDAYTPEENAEYEEDN
jgi:hypothetical protein